MHVKGSATRWIKQKVNLKFPNEGYDVNYNKKLLWDGSYGSSMAETFTTKLTY